MTAMPSFIVEEISPIDQFSAGSDAQRCIPFVDVRRSVIHFQLDGGGEQRVLRIGEILFGQIDVLRLDQRLEHQVEDRNDPLTLPFDRHGVKFQMHTVVRHQGGRQIEMEFIRLVAPGNETGIALTNGNVVRPEMKT